VFSEIIEVIDNFGFKPETSYKDNVLYIRVKGVDNVSLAKYILDKTNNYKITVKEREGYKFSDIEWIKIEPSETSQLHYTNRTNTCFF
jgi:hypothetical protein